MKVKQQGDRREIFLRYLEEVATAVSEINGADRDELCTTQLVKSPRSVTADADMKLDDRGKVIDEDDELDMGENVLIVDPQVDAAAAINRTPQAAEETEAEISQNAIDDSELITARQLHDFALCERMSQRNHGQETRRRDSRRSRRQAHAARQEDDGRASSASPTASSPPPKSGRTRMSTSPRARLSNVKLQPAQADPRNGQRQEPPAALRSVAGQGLHADDARGQRLQDS